MAIDPAVFHAVHGAAETATTERRTAQTLTAESAVAAMTVEQLRAATTALVRIAAVTGSQIVGEDVSVSDFQENLDLIVDEGLRGTGLPSVSSGDHMDYWAAAEGLPSETERFGVDLTDTAVVLTAARTLINELSPAFDPETLKLDLHDMAARAGVTINRRGVVVNALRVRGREVAIDIDSSGYPAAVRYVTAAALGALFLEHLPMAEEKGGDWQADYTIAVNPLEEDRWQSTFAAALLMPEAAFRAAVEQDDDAVALAVTFETYPQMVRERAAVLSLDLTA